MDRISAGRNEAASGPMELIGREPEIQQLRLFADRITQGAGEVLLLSGDPGVGKTSLLDVAAALAAWPAFRWPSSPRAGQASPASSTRETCLSRACSRYRKRRRRNCWPTATP